MNNHELTARLPKRNAWIEKMVRELSDRPAADVLMDLHTLTSIIERKVREEWANKQAGSDRSDSCIEVTHARTQQP